MLSFPPTVRIWLAAQPADLRKSFDGLAALVRQGLQSNPLSGDIFVFRNKAGDRIKLLLWKNNRVDAEQLIKVGDLVVDQANYAVTIAGQPLELTFKEYELLRFLATHRGRVFTREALLNQVWGYDYYGGNRTVDVHIRRIRAKLGTPYEDLVETVRNVGYRFNDPS